MDSFRCSHGQGTQCAWFDSTHGFTSHTSPTCDLPRASLSLYQVRGACALSLVNLPWLIITRLSCRRCVWTVTSRHMLRYYCTPVGHIPDITGMSPLLCSFSYPSKKYSWWMILQYPPATLAVTYAHLLKDYQAGLVQTCSCRKELTLTK